MTSLRKFGLILAQIALCKDQFKRESWTVMAPNTSKEEITPAGKTLLP